MKHLDGLLEMIEAEIKSIEQNGKFRSREEIDNVYKMIDIAKDVYCIWKYEDGMSEYSEDGGSYDGGSYDGGSYRSNRSYRGRSYNSYDDSMSRARGRGRNANRYADGRYASRGSYDGGSYRSRNYSREDAKEEYISELRELMQDAPDDGARQAIQRMITQMEND